MEGPEVSVIRETVLTYGRGYVVQIGVTGTIQTETGKVVDIEKLDYLLQEVRDVLAEAYINKDNSKERLAPSIFPSYGLTAEVFCVWLATKLMEFLLVSDRVSPSFVRVYDTPTVFAELAIK